MPDSNSRLDYLIGAIVAGSLLGIFGLLAFGIPVPDKLWDGVVVLGMGALIRGAQGSAGPSK